MEFVDRVLKCVDCDAKFVFMAGEQLFFHDKQFTNDPEAAQGEARAVDREFGLRRGRLARSAERRLKRNRSASVSAIERFEG